MAVLTSEQKDAIKNAGDKPVRLEDPETHEAYVLVKEDAYKRLQEAVEFEKIDPSFYEFGEFVPAR